MTSTIADFRPSTLAQPHPLQLGTQRPTDDTVIVRVDGDIDGDTAPRLHEMLQERVHGTIGTLVIDLTAVTFLSSKGLRTLELAYLLAVERGIACTLRPPMSAAVQRILTLFPMRFTKAIAAPQS
ncbi:STAS domain-containing protein [Amycolatopsis sp. FDAARGOS 1241]|uniref:STAS domain-containing protein n=1 Tax=Amycolatopsis sp. FDAARGOS 1241 TaxID=2778070 RepID=UPI00194DD2BF|nr:STAS domain-containing protein [Amycolatopsis sp. FDAARGOS 1241]QRP44743.1 STAS domain-containing protein [Amycolatopsis sp. FDAARGOS 1241]